MISIQSHGKTLSIADVDAWERCHGLALPADYRDFLLRYNGGRPSPASFRVPKWPGKESMVGDLLGIEPGGTCDIDRYWDEVRDRLPAELLPIGYDPGGNLICLAINGNKQGQVYYWDSSSDWELTEETGTLFMIAATFSEFLESLHKV